MLIRHLFPLANRQNPEPQGFTLLELLIVVIIIGILGAIAVPTLLAQVGKARETEAKNTLSLFNRAQQAYFMEKSDFALTFADLEVSVDNQTYYDYLIGSSGAKGIAYAEGKDNLKNGTRSYAGGVQYNRSTRQFTSILCRANVAPDFNIAAAGTVINNNGIITSFPLIPLTLQCNQSKTDSVK